MKRKIAAIFAADIAGYSRLVAEDEEETLRRLASYRSVTDDFIAKYGGRIFNTAGDAVLAEFPSAVEAVRCAIDIQESLRTRNMAYPPSRQMSFPHRHHDRRRGRARRRPARRRRQHRRTARGSGRSRRHLRFARRARTGRQQAVGAVRRYRRAGSEEHSDPGARLYGGDAARGRNVRDAASEEAGHGQSRGDTELDVASGGDGGLCRGHRRRRLPVFYQAGDAGRAQGRHPNAPATPAAREAAVPVAGSSAAHRHAPAQPRPLPRRHPAARHSKAASRPRPCLSSPDRARVDLGERICAPRRTYKAFALNTRPNAFVTGQPSEEAARSARRSRQCQKHADAAQPPRKCELYAVGNTVVYPHGRPPLPPPPWVMHDPSTERPVVASEVPMVRDGQSRSIEERYLPGRKSKAIAVGPGGQMFFFFNQERRRKRRGGRSKAAARSPASPARSLRSTTSSSCRRRRS